MTRESNSFYLQHVLPHVPRLLSAMDREPYSSTYGECDREHWAWKFRDFPIGVLQGAAYPLALLWQLEDPQNPHHRSEEIKGYARAALEAVFRVQRRNGAFDSFYPNEFDQGVTLGILHGICESLRTFGEALEPAWRQWALAAVRCAFDFSLRDDERHAFVSNHWALFAVTYHSGSELLCSPQLAESAHKVVARILREQSDEGWFNEYGGPDPGYESLGISYLAIYWRRTGDPEVLQALRRSVEFYSHCVHPDGSVGGCYGSRATGLYFPLGFEILKREIPLAGAIAAFMKARLNRHNTLTPVAADPMNLVPLLSNYLLASAESAGPRDWPGLPCELLTGEKAFKRSGLVAAGNENFYAVFGRARGGVCRVFDKRSQKLVYEDSGYVLRADSETWSSQPWSARDDWPESRTWTARFAVSTQRKATPWNYLLFRVLNLFVFPVGFLRGWLRRKMIRQLVLGYRNKPAVLERTVRLEPDRIEFADEIRLDEPVRIEEFALARLHTAMHMGSAKYFRASDGEPVLFPETAYMKDELQTTGHAKNCFSIVWHGDAGPRLLQGVRSLGRKPAEVAAIR
jgi:hypothetical protein